MTSKFSRRAAIAAGTSFFAGSSLPSLRAIDISLPSGAVQFRPEIEPLIRLIEDTPRERVLAAVAEKIRNGTSYRECLTALFLAAIRNVQPRPAVGFKFHSVLVINSAHIASIASQDEERWLPLFWAIDNFKSAQQQDVKEGNWTMQAIDEGQLPSASNAQKELRSAMQNWDVEAADVAAAVASRVLSAAQLFDIFAEFGSRDFRSIGHKAIYVAGAFRLLEVIGWEHSEPVIRSLAYALLNHTGEPNPSKSDLVADRQGRANQQRAASLRTDWLDGRPDDAATLAFIELARSAKPDELASEAVKLIDQGISSQSIFDGLFGSSAELVMRQPAIVPLHAMTTTNAIHFLMHRVHDDSLRRWLLLQNASFIGHFREAAEARGKLNGLKIDELKIDSGEIDVAQLLTGKDSSPPQNSSRVLSFLEQQGDARALMRRARQLVFRKGTDAHDYKYSAAILEDYYSLSPSWRNRVMAAGSALLPDESAKETNLAERVREAFA